MKQYVQTFVFLAMIGIVAVPNVPRELAENPDGYAYGFIAWASPIVQWIDGLPFGGQILFWLIPLSASSLAVAIGRRAIGSIYALDRMVAPKMELARYTIEPKFSRGDPRI